jgi:hypothetical protein
LSKNNLQRIHDEGTQALVANARKGKGKQNFGKRNTGGGSTQVQEQKKKDFSRIKCFNCATFGHYDSQCPQNKRKRNQHASTTNVDEDPEEIEHKNIRTRRLAKRPQAIILNIVFILMIQIYNTIMKPPQFFSH